MQISTTYLDVSLGVNHEVKLCEYDGHEVVPAGGAADLIHLLRLFLALRLGKKKEGVGGYGRLCWAALLLAFRLEEIEGI